MQKLLLLVIMGLIMISTSNQNAQNKNVSLIPLPEKVEWLKKGFTFSKGIKIECNIDTIKSYFIGQLKYFSGLELNKEIKTKQSHSIVFRIDKSLNNSNEEFYNLEVSERGILIKSPTEKGLFRGMQTLFQLIPPKVKTEKKGTSFTIQCCSITDSPKFNWRGLNLDCARHFMSKDFIKRYIDILAYYKFSILHWHLTEDQGWRIEIKKYPKLTEVGAWRKESKDSTYGGFYTQEDIKEIVEYADSRFITVVPEIEMPGHALASLASYPENSCTGGPFEVTNIWGVMNDVYCAGNDSTFTFLQNVLDEVVSLFPGKYIHIGGDEVPKDRWKNCPKCQARIKSEGLKDEHELQSYFVKRISNYLNSKGKTVIGWDEILQGGLAPGAIVQSWQSFQGVIDAAKLGHFSICSPTSHTYLDYDQDNLDLRVAYSFIPVPKELTPDEAKLVLGGEANLWSEHAPQETVDSKLFPRILALAEVFWSNPQNKNYDEFHKRIQNSYADLTALGIKYGRESKVINYKTSFNKMKNEFVLSITSGQNDAQIRYTKDGTEPTKNSPLCSNQIKVNSSLTLKVAAFRNDFFLGKVISLSFDFHKALNSKVTLKNKYDERYRAGGEAGLVDGLRGTNDFHDGIWQGYEGEDFECIIDLKKVKNISKIASRFILNSNSWVFLPNHVTISISTDNITFNQEKVIKNSVDQKTSAIILQDFTALYDNQKARYIKIKAESIKTCPDWHPGRGGKAWLFIDEIVVQ